MQIFFHCIANYHRRSNYVEKIKINNRMVKDNESLRQVVRDAYYKLYFNEYDWRVKLDDINFNMFDELNRKSLERQFTEEKIYKGFMHCRKD